MASPEAQAIKGDWEAVGGYLKQAMEEAANDISREAAEHVLESMGEGILPDPDALLYLERLDPGIAEWIIARSSEIQRETHERELQETSPVSRAKSLASGVLRLV